jgi:hypothetical protein
MASSWFDPAALLQGPRGRILLAALLDRDGQNRLFGGPASRRQPDEFVDGALRAIAEADLDVIARTAAPSELLDPLLESVGRARYWQEPDDHDWLVSQPPIIAALEPVAVAVSQAPAAGWWAAPVALDAQYTVTLEDPLHPGPTLATSDPLAALRDGRDHLLAHERQEGLPDDPTANSSGVWSSTPSGRRLLASTRALDGHGPLGLSQVEDDWGWKAAGCRRLQPAPDARVFEISGPADWIELVGRYPLAVPRSRRQDWYRTTGRHAHWMIPDYLALAGDFDAVHLSVLGYLSSAQRALEVPGGYSLLGGWPPDQTWWLSPGTREVGPIVRWVLDEDYPSQRTRWKREG